jgi:hypothetical protein
MVETITQALKGTPWWAFVLFAYLIAVGVRARKPSVVTLKRLIILPIIFTAMSLNALISLHGLHLSILIAWLVCFLGGGGFGWAMVQRLYVKVDHEQRAIHLPGSWSTLILILVVFATKYFFGYAAVMGQTYFYGYYFETHPEGQNSTFMTSVDPLVSAVVAGIFAGRFIYLLRRYRFVMSSHH